MNKLFATKQGNAAISFAIILPVLLLIVMAVIEFGMYFIKDQIALNGIASISEELRQDPTDPIIETNAAKYGGGFMSFHKQPNYFCAKSYALYEDAKKASCKKGWDTSKPSGLKDSDDYFIVIAAKTKKFEIAFSNFVPDIHREEIIKVRERVGHTKVEFGEKFSNSPHDSITLSDTIEVDNQSVITISANSGAYFQNKGNHGAVIVYISVNNELCSVDKSWAVAFHGTANYFSSASCIKELNPGVHKIVATRHLISAKDVSTSGEDTTPSFRLQWTYTEQ